MSADPTDPFGDFEDFAAVERARIAALRGRSSESEPQPEPLEAVAKPRRSRRREESAQTEAAPVQTPAESQPEVERPAPVATPRRSRAATTTSREGSAQTETAPVDASPAEASPTAASEQADGDWVRVSVWVPVASRDRVKAVAADRNTHHADVVIEQLARLAQETASQEPAKPVFLGDFEAPNSVKPTDEAKTLFGFRLSARNVAAMDALQERLGMPSRSALVSRALSGMASGDAGQ